MIRTVTKILGVDPGANVTGHATLLDFSSARRSLESTGILSTDPKWSLERRLDAQAHAFRILLEQKKPHVLALEMYVYQGERSHNKNAFWLSRLVGRFEEAAIVYGCTVVRVNKQQANAALGLRGKVSADRIRKTIALMFPMREVPPQDDDMAYTIAAKNRPRTPHEDDAIAAAVGGAQRWRLQEQIGAR